jgi:hypothetical protein
MGSDLFGSFAEATCAALVIAAQSTDLVVGRSGRLTVSRPVLKLPMLSELEARI